MTIAHKIPRFGQAFTVDDIGELFTCAAGAVRYRFEQHEDYIDISIQFETAMLRDELKESLLNIKSLVFVSRYTSRLHKIYEDLRSNATDNSDNDNLLELINALAERINGHGDVYVYFVGGSEVLMTFVNPKKVTA